MKPTRETEAADDMGPQPPPDPARGVAYYQLRAEVLARAVRLTPTFLARLQDIDPGNKVRDYVVTMKASDF